MPAPAVRQFGSCTYRALLVCTRMCGCARYLSVDYKSLMLMDSLSSTADGLVPAPNEDQTGVDHVLPEIGASGAKPGAHLCATPGTGKDVKERELSPADVQSAGEGTSEKSPITTVSGGAYACTLCRRHFKSQRAVDIHLLRNDECRRRKAALSGTSRKILSQRLFGKRNRVSDPKPHDSI